MEISTQAVHIGLEWDTRTGAVTIRTACVAISMAPPQRRTLPETAFQLSTPRISGFAPRARGRREGRLI